ncbi:MAG: response regulator transcription factor [Lachnospiraceae bacterium]|nr:response regulator transcription factor [Lachnospiraceae bacterium]
MMDKIRIALCDDNDMERRIIRFMINQYIKEHEYAIQLEEFSSGDVLLKSDVTTYDLVILDIYMGGLNGIDTAKELLHIHPKGKIIFCSSSNEFAEESYDVEAFRYLVKPLSTEKLHQCLDRFFRLCKDKKVLEYKYQRTVRSMLLKDVIWIEAAGRHSIIHTEKEQIETNTSLAEFAEKLMSADFVKPIRYALVSLKEVTEVTADTLVLTGGTKIPVSREKRKEIQEAFMQFQAL